MRPVDTLFARFPGPVTLTPSRLKLAIGLALCTGLTAFSVYLLQQAIAAWTSEVIWAGGSVLIIGGLTIRTSILLIVPGMVGLTLTADGFEIGSFFRRVRTRWRDASDFRVEKDEDGFRRVAYEVPDGSRRGERSPARCSENYAPPWDDFAWLMTAWRERALAQSTTFICDGAAHRAA